MTDNIEFAHDDHDIDEMIASAILEEPVTPESNLPHYGMSFLIHLPILKYHSNLQFVSNELARLPYFPRFKLLQLKTVSVSIPAERVATFTTAGSNEQLQQEFDPDEAANALKGQGAFNKITKSARACAAFCESLFNDFGYANFPSMTGFEYADARSLLDSFLPLGDPKYFPLTGSSADAERPIRRSVLGELFRPPFLDDVIRFLQENSPELILDLKISETQRDKVEVIYQEVLSGAQNAYTKAMTTLDESEEMISAKPQEKKGYDRRDRRFVNSPEPLDLLCLAMTNRKPADERALASAQALQQSANEPMVAAAHAMTRAAEAIAGQGSDGARSSEQMVPMSEISKIVEAQVAAALSAAEARTEAETPAAAKSKAPAKK